MKSPIIFYSRKEALRYINVFLNDEAEPEIIETEEWDDYLCMNRPCYAVYYNPPKLE